MKSHDLAQKLLALPNEEVGIRAYDRSNAWPVLPPRIERWDEMADSLSLKGSSGNFVLIETD